MYAVLGAARLLSVVLPPPTLPHALSLWLVEPAVVACVLVTAAGYVTLARSIARSHPRRPWPAIRTASFLSGLAVVAVALQSPAASYGQVLVTAHMVQHVLLIMAAPPLLVYGRPVTLILHALRNPAHTAIKRCLRGAVVRALTWPPGTTALYTLVVVGTHTPPFMDLAARSALAHAGEHLLYLGAGYLYFLPIVGSEPIGWRISFPGRYVMLLIGMQVDAVVGLAFLIQGHEIFPAYHQAAWDPAPLADLHAGGVVMWVGSDLVMAALALALAVTFVRDRRSESGLSRWIEGLRLAALRRQLRSTHLDTPSAPATGTIDDDDHLAAYNSYLAAIGDRQQPESAARRPRDHPSESSGY